MIQRIQTVFLLVVAILHISLFFVPFWGAANPLGVHILLDAAGVDGANLSTVKNLVLGNGLNAMKITIINSIIIFGALATIFLYNNRLTQIKFTWFLMMVTTVLLVVMFLAAEKVKGNIEGLRFDSNYSFGIIIPVISLILLFLSARRIRHDENLVRSADRLR
jgi:hypothetical protein